jgi:peptidylprolyl isomerase
VVREGGGMTRPLAILTALVVSATLPALAATAPQHAAAKAQPHKTVTLPDGLKYTDLVVGHGALPKPGQTAVVHYVGTFPDGRKFDSSRDRHQPFEFPLGAHQVISCWDEGVATMRVGGRRKLVCPPGLAYGPAGAGGVIPPNATLDFDVELLGLK